MAATPPTDPPIPPAENTGAVGPRGDDVDPAHIVKYLSPWKFGDPRNPPPENATDNFIEVSNQVLPDGDEQFDHIHPFKLQFYTEDDETEGAEEDDDGNVIENADEQITKKGEMKLRIYTGMLTATINTFTYSEDKDTDTTYEGDIDIAAYGGLVCGTIPDTQENVDTCTGNMAQLAPHPDPFTTTADNAHNCNHGTITSSEPTATTGGESDDSSHTHTVVLPSPSSGYDHPAHSHSVHSHYHVVPSHSHQMGDHRHHTQDERTPSIKLCELELTEDTEDIDHFLTIGGQPKIRGPLQIEPEGFEALTIDVDGEDTPTGYRAQTLDPTYGKVWLVWTLLTTGLDGAADNIVTGVKIVVQDEDPSEGKEAVALEVEGDEDGVTAKRDGLKDGTYALHIGTAFDADADDAEENPVGGIEQVIYENVYYSPLILPEINYE